MQMDCTLLNPIFNCTVDELDRHDRDFGVGQLASTEELLMDFLKGGKGRKWGMQQIMCCHGCFSAVLAVVQDMGAKCTDQLCLRKIGGRKLLTRDSLSSSD